ncbi:MAG: HAD family hydrolase [Dehalococcoidia bacterium]
MLGLPAGIVACLFDLDGVLTDTASVHAAAWKATFDPLLRALAEAGGSPLLPFDPVEDYRRYVDGRPRLDGVRSFLASRDITLPEGTADDTADAATVLGLGRRKNDLVLLELRAHAAPAYAGSVAYIRAARARGLRCAVVSSSANARPVLVSAGLADEFEVVVDGLVASARGLAGKPAPDAFLAAAEALAVPPGQAAVFEDALVGVEAGRAGGFGCVVGIDRAGQAEALRQHGADIVVGDLGELLGAA